MGHRQLHHSLHLVRHSLSSFLFPSPLRFLAAICFLTAIDFVIAVRFLAAIRLLFRSLELLEASGARGELACGVMK